MKLRKTQRSSASTDGQKIIYHQGVYKRWNPRLKKFVKVHFSPVNKRKVQRVFYTPKRYTPRRYTPIRYTPRRYTPRRYPRYSPIIYKKVHSRPVVVKKKHTPAQNKAFFKAVNDLIAYKNRTKTSS